MKKDIEYLDIVMNLSKKELYDLLNNFVKIEDMSVSKSSGGYFEGKKVVLTGIHFGNTTQGAYFYDSESGKTYYYCRETIDAAFHGTGDTFSSVLCAALTKGYTYENAIKIAVDFTVLCIEKTLPDRINHSYGTKFEECIPELVDMMRGLE